MGRIRTIKPQMFTDENLGDCSPNARWLFAGLFTLADREGRLEDRPRKIKVEVMPYDNVDIEHLLRELTEARFITRYEVEGKRCIHIRTFHKHQHVHPKELPSQLPEPPRSKPGKTSLAREKLGQSVRKGREGNGKGKDRKEEDARAREEVPADSPPPPDFFSEEFFDSLQDQKKFQHLDVRNVFQKWKNYCEASGKALDPKYFLNWLNREKGDLRNAGSDEEIARIVARLS